jgi:hypothetical protein
LDAASNVWSVKIRNVGCCYQCIFGKIRSLFNVWLEKSETLDVASNVWSVKIKSEMLDAATNVCSVKSEAYSMFGW